MRCSVIFASKPQTQTTSMDLETYRYKKPRGPILFLPHERCHNAWSTVHVLATHSTLQGPTPLPISSPTMPSPATPGKWACLQESDWVDAMMSGHRAAAFLKCVRPQLPFFFPWKNTQSSNCLPGCEAHIQMPYVVGPPRPRRVWRRTRVCHMGVFTTPAPLCLILDHILLTDHMVWE